MIPCHPLTLGPGMYVPAREAGCRHRPAPRQHGPSAGLPRLPCRSPDVSTCASTERCGVAGVGIPTSTARWPRPSGRRRRRCRLRHRLPGEQVLACCSVCLKLARPAPEAVGDDLAMARKNPRHVPRTVRPRRSLSLRFSPNMLRSATLSPRLGEIVTSRSRLQVRSRGTWPLLRGLPVSGGSTIRFTTRRIADRGQPHGVSCPRRPSGAPRYATRSSSSRLATPSRLVTLNPRTSSVRSTACRCSSRGHEGSALLSMAPADSHGAARTRNCRDGD